MFWVSAASDGENIYIFSDKLGKNEDLVELMIHEYVHICVDRTFSSECPIWLNEGLAMWFSGQSSNTAEEKVDNISNFYYANQYTTDKFYNKANYIIKRVLNHISVNQLIDQMRYCKNFYSDSIVGIQNIQLLLQ